MDNNINMERLPVIPLRNMVFFPGGSMPVMVGRDKTIDAVDRASEIDNRVFLVAQKKPDGDAEAANLYRVGTIAEIVQVIRMPNSLLKVIVNSESRGTVVRFSTNPNFVEAWVEPSKFISTDKKEEQGLAKRIIDTFREYVSITNDIPMDIITGLLLRQPDGEDLANIILSHLNISHDRTQRILESETILDLYKNLLEEIFAEIEVQKYTNDVEKKVHKKIDDFQRQFIIRQKVQALQAELGDGSSQKSESSVLLEKLEKANLPANAMKVAKHEIERLAKMHPVSAEATVARSYIEWLLNLPWDKFSKDDVDLKRAQEILDEDHYDLKDVKKRILEHIALVHHTGKIRGPILCLVGPPGVGKTSLGKSIARSMGREFVRISLGGVDDESEIRGHRRTYIGAMPGKIIQSMKKASTSNPVFLLDEVDKMGKSIHGDPSSALLEVLDPEQNSTFMDNYLETEYDLSQVVFITTANTVYGIPEPLLDRMEMLRIPGYTAYEKEKIARDFLIPKAAKEHGLDKSTIEFTPNIVKEIIDKYTSEAGVRQLEREIQKIMRNYVHKLILKKRAPFKRISSKMIREILGVPKSRKDSLPDSLDIGSSIGLAWTSGGGDTILIESSLSHGEGKLALTGRLGDVMKESAQAALSYVRSRAEKLGIKPEVFKENNIHIHIPEGAVPKDGPSAGITIAMALVSAFTQKLFPRDIAMTGEITLTGRILAIGGLPEKLIAAKRYGVKTVIVPKSNAVDLEEIDENIKKDLNIELYEYADDVLDRIYFSI